MVDRWLQGRGRRSCDRLTHDQGVRAVDVLPGTHWGDPVPLRHAGGE